MSYQKTVSAGGNNWRLERLVQSDRQGLSRVSALVNGEEVWFESGDVSLSISPEGIASLFLIPAMEQGVKVVLDDPVDGNWLDNIERLLPIWNRWWGYSLENPVVASRLEGRSNPASTRTGACFTGGADSFYTLLRGSYEIDVLIFVHGYDIPLEDRERMAGFEPALRLVAKKLNKDSVVIRTNLREHRYFAQVNWERTHGAALAGPAHLLRDHIGRLIIPSTLNYKSVHGWGSHWMTDPLWSSRLMNIIHDDANSSRSDKVRSIADDPLARKYLRVCWENRRPQGNCSCCEKCLRTMIALASVGRLADFTVFDQSQPLASRLRDLPRVPEHLVHVFAKLDRGDLPPDVRKELKRLIRRSRKYYQPGWFRYIARQVKWLAGQPD